MKQILKFSCMIALIFVFSACSSSGGETTEQPTEPDTTTEITEDEGTDIDDDETTEDADNNDSDEDDSVVETVPVGETVSIKEWEIVANSFEKTESIKATYGGYSPDEGNLYFVANLTVKNTGTDPQTFYPYFGSYDDISASLEYQGSYTFSATNLMGHSDDLHDATLNPLSSTTGIIVFSVAEEVANNPDDLVFIISAGNEKVRFLVSY